jgi:hypothetical protein
MLTFNLLMVVDDLHIVGVAVRRVKSEGSPQAL